MPVTTNNDDPADGLRITINIMMIQLTACRLPYTVLFDDPADDVPLTINTVLLSS